MKITIVVEGKTELAFKTHLESFLKTRVHGEQPRISFFSCDGRIYKEAKLRKTVEDLLKNGKVPSDAVIALTDVYTGTKDFFDAADAKQKMRAWLGAMKDFILTLRSTTSKPGCFRSGATFRLWPDTRRDRRQYFRKL